MADPAIQIVSNENGQPTAVLVPALKRDDGLSLEDVVEKPGL